MQRTLFVVHRRAALVVDLVLICTAGSGAILVFEAEIDTITSRTVDQMREDSYAPVRLARHSVTAAG